MHVAAVQADPNLFFLLAEHLSVSEIFRKLADCDETAMQLALEFYGPMYLLYSVYDGAEKKEAVSSLLAAHIDRFIAGIESGYRETGRNLL